MPSLRGRFADGKPIVKVGLAPALPRPGEVSPFPNLSAFQITPLRALLDTGADGTSITRKVAASHNLEFRGMRGAISIGGSNTLPTWTMFLAFFFDQDADFEGDNHTSTGVFMFPRPLLALGIGEFDEFDVIVGRDVLGEYDFRSVKGDWELKLS